MSTTGLGLVDRERALWRWRPGDRSRRSHDQARENCTVVDAPSDRAVLKASSPAMDPATTASAMVTVTIGIFGVAWVHAPAPQQLAVVGLDHGRSATVFGCITPTSALPPVSRALLALRRCLPGLQDSRLMALRACCRRRWDLNPCEQERSSGDEAGQNQNSVSQHVSLRISFTIWQPVSDRIGSLSTIHHCVLI